MKRWRQACDGCTPIRVVIIDPYNQEIRQAKMARGLFKFDFANGGCLEFRGHLTRTSELHMYRDGDGPHGFVIRQLHIFHGLGFVTGGKDAQGSPRSSTISVAKVLSITWFPDTFSRESAG